jgi:Ferredoxin-dependent bilin reductase
MVSRSWLVWIVVLRYAAAGLHIPQKASRGSLARQTFSPSTSALRVSELGDAFGLYRPFAEHAWDRLWKTCGSQLETTELPEDLTSNQAPAHGGGTVQMTVRAATGTGSIQYARYALLQTIGATGGMQSAGIQVLNMVIFPAENTGFPVFGADFVSLPGGKHLLLLDAQPVSDYVAETIEHWKEWYERHCIAKQFPWGGDLPEKVQPYVSKHALWTRLGGGAAQDEVDATDPIELIQGPIMAAFAEHLDLYLDLMMSPQQQQPATTNNRLSDYIRYRLENDPARPMLKRLYGEEWTEKVLNDVLFPQLE